MDIEQLEALALGEDRDAALARLIPGTEDHYFHHCLAHQQRGEDEALAKLLAAWVKRHGETARVREIRDRQVLLSYERAPKRSLEYLRRRLNLSFDHQREVEGAPSELPTRLDPARIGREAFSRDALAHHRDLAGFSDRALDWLAEDEGLDLTRLRALLSRLRRPDYPKIVAHVLRELADPHSSGFGSLAIHTKLTAAQLDELAAARPALRENPRFVEVRLSRMRPGPNVDLDADPEQLRAYLDAAWRFVEPLVEAFNSLKLHLAHHRLEFDRRHGIYDRQRFDRYLALPRQAAYVAAAYRHQHRHALANFGRDFAALTGLATVRDDTELVRDYLAHFFADPELDDYAAFRPLLDEDFVRQVFAETKILAGLGDRERWYSLLDDPGYYGELEQRVEIRLCPDNPRSLPAQGPLELHVELKKVPTLVVKVFEINTLAYFARHGREVDTGVDLDGLVAKDERVLELDDPPLRRVRHTLRFDELTRPGTYVIELIGGGKSSRALIRKGALRYVERLGAAGHVLAILDEDDQLVPDASVHFGGREYRADEHGEIRIPYGAGSATKILSSGIRTPQSPSPPARILLRHASASTVASFRPRAERYALAAGFHVEREQLIAGREAELVVRASLTLSGFPVSPSLLQEPKLTISSRDRHNTESSVTVAVELDRGAELVHAFKVPEDLEHLAFELRAKVRSLSEQRDIELVQRSSLSVNEIDRVDATAGLHLAPTAGGHVLWALGKSGEPRAGMQVNLRFAHHDFHAQLQIALKTDARGRVELGALAGIRELWAAIGGGAPAHWTLPRARASLPSTIHVAAGEDVVLPRLDLGHGRASSEAPLRSLLERRGDGYLRDCIAAVEVDEDAVRLRGLEPGDYELVLGCDREVIQLRVGGPNTARGWALSPGRHLQLRPPEALRIAAIEADDHQLRVRIAGVDEDTRVHLFATRFLPPSRAGAVLDHLRLPSPTLAQVGRSRCHYLSGRDIGDEYRYILERRRAEVFAGNMLERPGLLLNPWALRTTSTATQDARAGGSYDALAAEERARMAAPAPARRPAPRSAAPSNKLDFLAALACVRLNLEPDEAGVVVLDRAALDGQQLVHVVAANAIGVVSADLALAEVESAPRDLRLLDALAAEHHFVKRKQRSCLAPGETLSIENVATARLETVDTLAKAHALLVTLSEDEQLREFEFVTRWPSLSPEDKREKYSKYACHELSLFLARKDPEFFTEVIRPYLANKRDRTFIDRYLLADDLSALLEPWAYGRLNTLERILLAERVRGEGGPGSRHIGDRFDLLPPDVEGDNAAFDTALQGSALDASAPGLLEAAAASTLANGLAGYGGEGAAPGGALAFAELADEADDSPLLGGGGPPTPKAAAAAPPPPPQSAASGRGRARAAKKKGRRADTLDAFDLEQDLSARAEQRRLYRPADKTQEWAENNYYRRRLSEQGPDLIPVNAFWRDFAAHVEAQAEGEAGGAGRPFLSAHFVRATSCFAEMLCALAVLDLPFTAQAPTSERAGAGLRLRANTPLVAFHEQVAAVEDSERNNIGVLVSQNYFRADDRYRYEGNERHDKYVEGEFLIHTVYLCRVVLTNPSSSAHKLELLLQIPRGAVPVANGFATRDVHAHLQPHGTLAFEYSFYFPAPGEFAHFPVHVARHGELVAYAEPHTLEVLSERRSVDTGSWSHLSQHGSEQELLAYLDAHNLERLELRRIAWRMRERPVFEAVLDRLRQRHVYSDLLWSYAIHHDDRRAIGEYLRHQDAFLRGCGQAIDSPLVSTDPVVRRWYQHLEYAPLINARAHQLGDRREILNEALAEQYRAFLGALCYQARPSDDQLASAAYYLLLQDRVAEGLAMLERIDPERVRGQLQLDYLRAYAALFRGEIDRARALAEPWREHGVDRWRKRFAALIAVLDEAAGAEAQLVDADSREQEQARLSASEPGLDFDVEGKSITITYQNLRACTLRYYEMDIELLFSRQPFMKDESGRFALVSPNHSEDVELPEGETELELELPAAYRSANTIIEVLGGGLRRSQQNYAHDLAVRVIEPYGQLRVHARGGGPLPRTYVKVYAREHGGSVGFYKDGYTDVRGAFDYASLSTDQLDRVERFAILVMSKEHGALIREAEPPQR
jgi:hypothetical protein